jgi:hypothetical protein
MSKLVQVSSKLTVTTDLKNHEQLHHEISVYSQGEALALTIVHPYSSPVPEIHVPMTIEEAEALMEALMYSIEIAKAEQDRLG